MALPRSALGGRGGYWSLRPGNITNAALLALFEANLDLVLGALGEADFVELRPEATVVHRRRDDPSS